MYQFFYCLRFVLSSILIQYVQLYVRTCVAATSLSPGLAKAASMAVVVVPRLDPRVKG